MRIPPPTPEIARWLVFAIDASLSRTGFALVLVTPAGDNTRAEWLSIGSLQPADPSEPIWARSKALALALREQSDYLLDHLECLGPLGLLISLEAPTPRNDFLTTLSRILHVVLLEGNRPRPKTRVLMTNASTLRSLMGLKQTGRHNKRENVLRAYDFVDREDFPNLDSDACDAVLLAMMGRHAASILLGFPQEVPDRVLNTLCNSTEFEKGKGTHKRTVTKGLLHSPESWWQHLFRDYAILVRNARRKETRLKRLLFSI